MKHLFSLAMALVVWHMPLTFLGQNPDSFPFSLEVTAVDIPDLPGIHSYAQAQHEGKWLILGGRLDGLHARQPFNAFPAGSNNTLMMVVDIDEGTVHTASVEELAPSVAEQLQSSNMNFHQVEDVLYLVGGYAYSASGEDHMTYPRLTALSVPGFINAIVQGGTFEGLYDSVEDDYFAVTGGHLNRLGDRLALVGGHRFDGRYNPMGNPTYIQTYTNAIRLFSASFAEGTVAVGDFESWSDEVHLHRRDYNLLPFKTNDGSNGLTLFSGVFQINEDLPFLYPVSITEEGHEPVTEFNQHLSQYHSGCVSLYDQTTGQTHSLFFGGMSQFQLDENNELVEDPLVPFVNTISRVVRHSDGSFEEFQLPATMNGLHGSSAGFFVAEGLPLDASSDLVLMEELGESLTLGYVVGGINSSQTNPFSFNDTGNTNASSSVYQVTLTRTSSTGEVAIQRPTSPSFAVYPNPTDGEVQLAFELKASTNVDLMVTDNLGRLVMNQSLGKMASGTHLVNVEGLDAHAGETMLLTLVFDHRNYASQPVLVLD